MDYILYTFPIFAYYVSDYIPIRLLFPVYVFTILYGLTFLYSRFIKCKKLDNQKAKTEILKPLSIFIPALILMYVAAFIRLPLIKVADLLINNMITWAVLFGWLYHKLFNSTFDSNSC